MSDGDQTAARLDAPPFLHRCRKPVVYRLTRRQQVAEMFYPSDLVVRKTQAIFSADDHDGADLHLISTHGQNFGGNLHVLFHQLQLARFPSRKCRDIFQLYSKISIAKSNERQQTFGAPSSYSGIRDVEINRDLKNSH
jgi:hypothetical protein